MGEVPQTAIIFMFDERGQEHEGNNQTKQNCTASYKLLRNRLSHLITSTERRDDQFGLFKLWQYETPMDTLAGRQIQGVDEEHCLSLPKLHS